MRHKLTVIIGILALMTGRLTASPYTDVNASTNINGHQWGVWRVVDVPTGGLDNIFARNEFKTYWFLGLGTFIVVQMSQGTLIVGILGAIVSILLIFVRLRRKRKQEKTKDSPQESSMRLDPT